MPEDGGAPSCSLVILARGGGGRGGQLSKRAEGFSFWALGLTLFSPLGTLNPLSHIRLMSTKEFFKYVPSSLLFILFAFSPLMVPQCGICRVANVEGSGLQRAQTESAVSLAAGGAASKVSFHLMFHIPLSTSVSDFQGTTLILHQTFPMSLLIPLLSG